MMSFLIDEKSIEDEVIHIQRRSMSDPTFSDIDFKIKMAWIWTTLKSDGSAWRENLKKESFRDEDLSLPTWQWINELLIGNHLASRIILLARPETIAFHKTPNPFYHVS